MRRLIAALIVVLALTGCTGESRPATAPSTAPPGHDHGAARVSLPVGDGTERYDVGYTLADVRLPRRPREPGRLTFRIDNSQGRAHTRFLAEQTKLIHVYVVREDLAVFRHVHPDLGDDGTWRGTITVPEPGDYRVIAEFVARDAGGGGDHVLLGDSVTVGGEWQPQAPPDTTGTGSDWALAAEVRTPLRAGIEQLLRIRLRRVDGAALALGRYLGTAAHLTGFHAGTKGAVHVHPFGEPIQAGDGAVDLEFHTEMPTDGTYLLFLQVRVDEFLHTLAIPVAVAARY